MAVTKLEYLLLNGSRYYVAGQGQSESFTRYHQPVEAGQVSGKRVQSPFVDAEVVGFESGEGRRTLDAEATGYYSSSGMEPHTEVPTEGHLRLKVGRSFAEAWAAVASAGGYVSLAIYANKLYALRRDAAIVDDWDGTTLTARDFSAQVGAGKVGTNLFVAMNVLFIGTNHSNNIVYSTNGTSFSNTFLDAGYPDGADIIGINGPNDDLWVMCYSSSSDKSILKDWEGPTGGATKSSHETYEQARFATGLIFNETLYYWMYRHGNTKQPSASLFTRSAARGTGTYTRVHTIRDNYPVSSAVYRGAIYVGMAWGGSVRRLENDTLVEVGHFGDTTAPATVPGSDAIYALFVFGDSLYAAGYDSSAASGQRTWIRRYRLDDKDNGGWHLIATGGDDLSTAIRSLAAFQQTLVFGDAEATDGRVYEQSKTSRLTSARLTTPDFQFGAPTVKKRFVEIKLQHDALLAGQAVDLRYALDGGAEVSVGINRDVGSTETVFKLAETLRGSRLRFSAYFTNGAAQDLIVASAACRMIPAPAALEVWAATLKLDGTGHKGSGSWSDAVADSGDAITKFNTLSDLKLSGSLFQVVDPFRESSLPKRAMLATFDPQVPLQPRILAGPTVKIFQQIRLLQAAHPENLVLNASFEQNAAPNLPTSWTETGTGTSAQVSTAVTAQDGGNVARLVFDGASASYGITQSIAGLVAGRYYTVSGYIRRATSGGVVKIRAFESGILDVNTGDLAAATDSAFIRYSVGFLLPLTSSGTIAVQFIGTGTPAGTAYADAIQLEESIPVSTFKERGSGG